MVVILTVPYKHITNIIVHTLFIMLSYNNCYSLSTHFYNMFANSVFQRSHDYFNCFQHSETFLMHTSTAIHR